MSQSINSIDLHPLHRVTGGTSPQLACSLYSLSPCYALLLLPLTVGPEPRSEDLPPLLPSASPQLSIDTSFLEKTLYLLAQMGKAGSQRVLATQDQCPAACGSCTLGYAYLPRREGVGTQGSQVEAKVAGASEIG